MNEVIKYSKWTINVNIQQIKTLYDFVISIWCLCFGKYNAYYYETFVHRFVNTTSLLWHCVYSVNLKRAMVFSMLVFWKMAKCACDWMIITLKIDLYMQRKMEFSRLLSFFLPFLSIGFAHGSLVIDLIALKMLSNNE